MIRKIKIERFRILKKIEFIDINNQFGLNSANKIINLVK